AIGLGDVSVLNPSRRSVKTSTFHNPDSKGQECAHLSLNQPITDAGLATQESRQNRLLALMALSLSPKPSYSRLHVYQVNRSVLVTVVTMAVVTARFSVVPYNPQYSQ